MNRLADVGVIGGTGLYALEPGGELHDVTTPYGPPSSAISVHEIGPHRVEIHGRRRRRHERRNDKQREGEQNADESQPISASLIHRRPPSDPDVYCARVGCQAEPVSKFRG